MSLLVLLVAGCGGGKSPIITPPNTACVPSTKPQFAYQLGNELVASSQLVYSYSVNSCTGFLTPTNPASVTDGGTTGEPLSEAMVVDPLGQFVYVANIVSNATSKSTISMYKIDQTTGVLTPTSPATVKTGFFPQGITTDPLGRFVYTGNTDDNTVSMFTVDRTTGLLTPTVPASIPAGGMPGGVRVHPSGKFAYVANQLDNTVSMYAINQTTGVLTPLSPAIVPAGNSPFGVDLDPAGRFAYVADPYSNDNRVSVLTVDQTTGVLTPSQQGHAIAGPQPVAVAVDPSGKYAYVANRQDSTISIFSIDQTTGDLTAMGTIATGPQPYKIFVGPSGKVVYSVNEAGASTIFTIGSGGALTPSGQATASDLGSFDLVVGPSAK